MTRNSTFDNLEQNQKDAITRHLSLFMAKNKEINLSAIRETDKAKVLHLEDSLSVMQEIDAAPEGLYIDLGSGGGFPGIPLAVASGRPTVLVESVKKKAKALEEFSKQLNLSRQIKIECNRIEELPHEY